MEHLMIDLNSAFGKRAARRLEEEDIIWLTTVDRHGNPQPRPVWFLWEAGNILIFSQQDAYKVSHIRNNPRVSLNLDSARNGEDIVVLLGKAEISKSPVPQAVLDKYLVKYRLGLEMIDMTQDQFVRDYNLAIIISPEALRGY